MWLMPLAVGRPYEPHLSACRQYDRESPPVTAAAARLSMDCPATFSRTIPAYGVHAPPRAASLGCTTVVFVRNVISTFLIGGNDWADASCEIDHLRPAPREPANPPGYFFLT